MDVSSLKTQACPRTQCTRVPALAKIRYCHLRFASDVRVQTFRYINAAQQHMHGIQWHSWLV
jgi:hypothetical protein